LRGGEQARGNLGEGGPISPIVGEAGGEAVISIAISISCITLHLRKDKEG